MNNEGYIKFQCAWRKDKAVPRSALVRLNFWRNRLYAAGLIGAYPDGIGFGNISRRIGATRQFIITGSATGALETLKPAHFSRVLRFDLDQNFLECAGPIKASSESMTHGALYLASPSIRAVVHVHHERFWRAMLHRLPTTAMDAAYGTPEMAREVLRLAREPVCRQKRLIIMGGHPEGILSFGRTLADAATALLNEVRLRAFHPAPR